MKACKPRDCQWRLASPGIANLGKKKPRDRSAEYLEQGLEESRAGEAGLGGNEELVPSDICRDSRVSVGERRGTVTCQQRLQSTPY